MKWGKRDGRNFGEENQVENGGGENIKFESTIYTPA